IAMKLDTFMRRIGISGASLEGKTVPQSAPPVLKDAVRQPNGTFQFKAQLAKGTPFVVQSSIDAENWSPLLNGVSPGELTSYADGQASRFNYRFYRLLAGHAQASNVLGYVSTTLPPGGRGCSLAASPARWPGPPGPRMCWAVYRPRCRRAFP